MKKSKKWRIASFVMALLLAVSSMPFASGAEVKAAETTKTYSFDATKCKASKDKELLTGKVADDFITVFGEVVLRVNKSGKVTSSEIPKSLTGGYQFEIIGTADVTFGFSSTGTDNESEVQLVKVEGETKTPVVNKAGETVAKVKGTTSTPVAYSVEAGTYQIVSPVSDLNRGARIFSITITETSEDVTAHSITLDLNYEGAPDNTTYTVNEGASYTSKLGEDPTRDGYTFDGWYEDATCETAASGTMGTSDITLYAKWIENATTTITETFDISVLDDNSSLKAPISQGNIILYATSSKAVSVRNSDSSFATGGKGDKAGRLVLFNIGGSNAKISMTVESASNDSPKPARPVAVGKIEGGSLKATSITKSITDKENVELDLSSLEKGVYALYSNDSSLRFYDKIEVSYDRLNDDEYVSAVYVNSDAILKTELVKKGSVITPPTMAVKNDTVHNTIYWYTTPDFQKESRIDNISEYKATSSAIYYPKEELDEAKFYKLILDSQGGSEISGSPLLISKTSGSVDLTADAMKPRKEGFVFDGWYTSAEGGIKIDTITKDTEEYATLYAHWTESTVPSYDVQFILGDNGVSSASFDTQKVNEGDTVLTPVDIPASKDEKYRFAGWYADEACTTEWDFETPITGATTIYAKWQEFVSEKFDISTIAKNTYTEPIIQNNITVFATDNASVEVDSSKRLKLGGQGSINGKYISFDIKGANGKVEFTASSSNSSDNRILKIAQIKDGELKPLDVEKTIGTSASNGSIGGLDCGTYAIYSEAGGINFTGNIVVTYDKTSTDYVKTTFMVNGLPHTVSLIEKDAVPSILEIADTDDLMFKGWSTTENGSVEDISTTAVSSDVVYYAIWDINTNNYYKVTFDSQGGSDIEELAVKKSSTTGIDITSEGEE